MTKGGEVPNCVFCGGHATLTREHVLPQWVGSLSVGEGPFTIRRIAATGEALEYRAAVLTRPARG
jgi:hypothetical protein